MTDPFMKDYILGVRREWLKNELEHLPFFKELRLKFYYTNAALSDAIQETIEASEHAIKVIQEEIDELTGKNTAATELCKISY